MLNYPLRLMVFRQENQFLDRLLKTQDNEDNLELTVISVKYSRLLRLKNTPLV